MYRVPLSTLPLPKQNACTNFPRVRAFRCVRNQKPGFVIQGYLATHFRAVSPQLNIEFRKSREFGGQKEPRRRCVRIEETEVARQVGDSSGNRKSGPLPSPTPAFSVLFVVKLDADGWLRRSRVPLIEPNERLDRRF